MYEVISVDQCGASQLSAEKATVGVCIQCQEKKCWSPHVFGNDCVLMQYTDLKDKNGKEIYEGDLYLWEVDPGENDICGVVKRSGAFGFISQYTFNTFYQWYGDVEDGFITDGEVIGNVYETPELLNG